MTMNDDALPVLIIRAGGTVPEVAARRGDFEDWFAAGMGIPLEACRVSEPYRGEALPEPSEVAGAVVSGSSSMASEHEDWSVETTRWMRTAVEAGVPVLGVCYGHQLLAEAFGGRVDWNPRGREIGCLEVELSAAAHSDELFGDLPSPLLVHTTHSQSVVELPQEGTLLASNDHDPHQAFSVGDHAWGVQFHPEFDADIIRGYLRARRSDIEGEGIDVDARIAETRDDPSSAKILARFAEFLRLRPS